MAHNERSQPMDDTGAPERGVRWFVVVPAFTLLVGMVLGGLIVGVTDVGSEPEAQPTATSSPSPGDPSPSQDVTVVVPQECLEAAETVQEATELIRDGVEGRLVPPGDVAALANAIEALARDPTARAALGFAAFRRLRRDFSAGMGLDLLAKRFRPLLGEPAALPAPAREAAAR